MINIYYPDATQKENEMLSLFDNIRKRYNLTARQMRLANDKIEDLNSKIESNRFKFITKIKDRRMIKLWQEEFLAWQEKYNEARLQLSDMYFKLAERDHGTLSSNGEPVSNIFKTMGNSLKQEDAWKTEVDL